MAGKNGGARPGAGRKRKTTAEQQLSRRDVVLSVFNADELRECLLVILGQIKAGQTERLYPLLAYILGSPKQEISVSFDVQQTALELAEKYDTTPEHVISIVERLKTKRAG
jgi:hypothetical protein